ncbi:hypothetical protein Ahy_A06g027507 [Arachis hypogaea]|uniref:Uncharacterized protein n=1 Tax=Arachis hypogaea TaxID=3818 RepID=A0A445CNV2_ARAHY|nr:hypothetical protein Ahy_A06g027507 [Arachis hypogaea]
MLYFALFHQLLKLPHLSHSGTEKSEIQTATKLSQIKKKKVEFNGNYSVLNGDRGVDTVLIIEINVINTKALKTTLTTRSNIFRGTIDYNSVRSHIHFDNTKFGGNLNLITRYLKTLGSKLDSRNFCHFCVCVPSFLLYSKYEPTTYLPQLRFEKLNAHPGNRTPVSTVGGYYDTTTPDALLALVLQVETLESFGGVLANFQVNLAVPSL